MSKAFWFVYVNHPDMIDLLTLLEKPTNFNWIVGIHQSHQVKALDCPICQARKA